MDETPIPVIVVHWNAPEWCARTVESIRSSRGIDVRVMVADNGPPGRSARLDSLLPPEVEVVRMPDNLGYAGAANVLLDRVLGEPGPDRIIVCCHDVDVAPDCLAELVRVARASDLAIAGPNLGHPDHPGVADPEWTAPTKGWVSGTCLLVSRSILGRIGGFDSRLGSYAEDVDLCMRATRVGATVGVVRDARATTAGQVAGFEHAIEMTRRNGLLLARRDHGRLAAAAAAARYSAEAARHVAGALAPTRTRDRRRSSARRARAIVRGVARGLREGASMERDPTAPVTRGARSSASAPGRSTVRPR